MYQSALKVNILHSYFAVSSEALPATEEGELVKSLVLSSVQVESVQDFLIKLDMKPCMNLVEISIFSLNLVIVRLTKIMNRADKNWAQF